MKKKTGHDWFMIFCASYCVVYWAYMIYTTRV